MLKQEKVEFLRVIKESGLYRVDIESGDVYGWRFPNKRMTQREVLGGYLAVTLSNGKGCSKQFMVHLVVAFFGGLDVSPGKQINHIDGNKLNNSICNLESVLPHENMKHALRNGLIHSKITHVDAEKIRRDFSAGCSLKEVAASYKISKAQASSIVIGDCWNPASYGGDPSLIARKNYAPQRKINFEKAEAIRREYAAGGVSQASLAVRYGICQTQVSRILRGLRWSKAI